MRFCGAALIIFSCGAMGLIAAAGYAQQVKNLRQLVTFVQMLESEISFVRTSLPEIMLKLDPQFSGALQRFAQTLSDDLRGGSGDLVSEIWQRAVSILAKSGFPREVVEELVTFGATLGSTDITEQQKQLDFVQIRLQQSLEKAEAERARYTKMYQYMGFCAGLFLVLLLF